MDDEPLDANACRKVRHDSCTGSGTDYYDCEGRLTGAQACTVICNLPEEVDACSVWSDGDGGTSVRCNYFCAA